MRYLVARGIHEDYSVVYSTGSEKEADDLVDALNRVKDICDDSYYKVTVEDVVAKEGYLDEFLLVSVSHDNKYSSRFGEVTYTKVLRFQLEGLKVGYEKFEHTSYYSELYEGVEEDEFSEWEFRERAVDAVDRGIAFSTDVVRESGATMDVDGVSFDDHHKEVVDGLAYVAKKLGSSGETSLAQLVNKRYLAQSRLGRLDKFRAYEMQTVGSEDLKMFRQAIKQFKQKYGEVE